jgi:hypothetical protein
MFCIFGLRRLHGNTCVEIGTISAIGSLRKQPRVVWRASPPIGGCSFFEDPRRDARTAQPIWLDSQAPLIRLIPDSEDRASRFSLWRVPGTKALVHDGRQLLLVGMAACQAVCVALAWSLGDESSFAYALPASASTAECARVLESVAILMGSAQRRVRRLSARRPSSRDMVNVHALQVADAVTAGASHREIATALYDKGDVAIRWEPDGELRARVRYLIRRGKALINGGYRELVDGRRSESDGEGSDPSDSP